MPTDSQSAYPSGLSRTFSEPTPDVPAWGQDLEDQIVDQPLGTRAPCMNPECSTSVDYGDKGPGALYCSHHCRTRASRMRARATQQLRVIETALGPESRYRRGLPREELRARAAHLRWWLARLAPSTAGITEDGHRDGSRPT